MYTIILSQDRFIHKDALLFPFNERGMQFGDGVYEVIRIYEGNFYLLEDHLNRLDRSLDALQIHILYSKDELKKNLEKLIPLNEVKEDAFLYLQVTRGIAERDHAFPEKIEPNVFAYIKRKSRPLDFIQQGVTAITYPDQRWDNCYIKSLNLLPNVLAKQKAKEEKAYEAILHREGEITEGSSSNIFLVKDETIFTHPVSHRILNGCVRQRILQLAKEEGWKIVEEAFSIEDLKTADELFLTSTISEIMPITQVDKHPIGDGKVGSVTKELQTLYERDARLYTRKVSGF